MKLDRLPASFPTAGAFVGLLTLLLLSGCASFEPTWVPDHFSTVDEAFPNPGSLSPPAQKPDAWDRAVFSAPYDDVYRAVLVALSQAQFSIKREDKSTGVLYSTRIVPNANQPGNGGVTAERRYFYVIRLEELDGHTTRVTIYSKAQGRCVLDSLTASTVVGLGITNSRVLSHNETCRHYASVHWAGDFDNSKAELEQFMNFTRNNLLSAGLI